MIYYVCGKSTREVRTIPKRLIMLLLFIFIYIFIYIIIIIGGFFMDLSIYDDVVLSKEGADDIICSLKEQNLLDYFEEFEVLNGKGYNVKKVDDDTIYSIYFID